VCVDLDGVLAHYEGWRGAHHIGEPIPEGFVLLKALRAMGFKIIIHTCRMNGQWPGVDYQESRRRLEEWLDDHGIPYDRVATQMDGKPFADVYVDDRAVHFNRGDPGILTKILQVTSTGWGKEAES
jgi:adenylylsulfate kinase